MFQRDADHKYYLAKIREVVEKAELPFTLQDGVVKKRPYNSGLIKARQVILKAIDGGK